MSTADPTATAATDVRCRWCGRNYDLMRVETVGRYADCTVFKTPCCGRQADDREGKSLPDFYRLTAADPWVDLFGVIHGG